MNISLLLFFLSPPVPEEPKTPVDPAVRAKENWLRLYNKVLEQLREVKPQVNHDHKCGSFQILVLTLHNISVHTTL